MKNFKTNLFIIALFTFLFILAGNHSIAKDLTEETGKALLDEIKKLNKTLNKLQQPQEARPEQARPEPKKDAKVTTKGGAILGKKNAPITIVEFTDYQCPFCKRFSDTTFQEIKKQYIDSGKVKFVSRNLPLPFHKDAKNAAEAVMCAGDQKKYWQMRDKVFTNPRALSMKELNKYAQEVSLNMKKFTTCMDKDTYLKQIDKDTADAQSIGISGTPSFVVAPSTGTELVGEVVIGAQPFSKFDEVIKRLLKSKK